MVRTIKSQMSRRSVLSLLTLTAAVSATYWYWPGRWNYIVIHHSAGTFGNVQHLQNIHRSRQPWDPIDAIAYHYIIGNGNGLPMGEIATDWRQQYNLWGAHLTAKNIDRNFRGIGICLIGNFDRNPVPQKQYKALVTLVRELMKKYSIPSENVMGHSNTPGESTRCPGRYFPFPQLRKDISI